MYVVCFMRIYAENFFLKKGYHNILEVVIHFTEKQFVNMFLLPVFCVSETRSRIDRPAWLHSAYKGKDHLELQTFLPPLPNFANLFLMILNITEK